MIYSLLKALPGNQGTKVGLPQHSSAAVLGKLMVLFVSPGGCRHIHFDVGGGCPGLDEG